MAAKDLGPLDWKIPIVNTAGQPTEEFQRRWATQRANNALIGGVTLGHGPPVGVPSDGSEYLDIDANPFALYAGSAGTWHQVGPRAFIDLDDAPTTYAGSAVKLVRVNAGANGVEFAALSAVLDGLGAARGDVLYRGAAGWLALPPGTAGNVLATAGAGADPSWAALPTISALLDTISSTRGTVLYRGAAGWAALAPGTAGNVLTTAGAGADPSWAAGGGGGGGGRNTEATWTKPVIADFGTTVNITRSSLTNGTNALVVDYPGANANNELYLKAAPATPYDVCMRYKMFIDNSGTQAQFGLVFRNSTSGKIVILGEIAFQGSNILAQNWTSATVFSGTLLNTAFWPSGPSLWLRMSNDGTNINFYCSPDGWNWQKVAAAATLASFIGAVDQVGFYAFAGAGTNYCRSCVYSFTTAIPAP